MKNHTGLYNTALLTLVLHLAACSKPEQEPARAVTPLASTAKTQPESEPASNATRPAPSANTTAAPAASDKAEKSGKTASTPGKPVTPTQKTAVKDPKMLATQSGCFACHAIDTKKIGPAWKDVAQRYQGNTDARKKLIEKIKHGGTGNWTKVTGGMSMPPYSPRVSDTDIASLVDFILSLQ